MSIPDSPFLCLTLGRENRRLGIMQSFWKYKHICSTVEFFTLLRGVCLSHDSWSIWISHSLGQNILPRQSTSFSHPLPCLMNEMILPNYNALISWDFVSTIPHLLCYPGFYGFDWNYPLNLMVDHQEVAEFWDKEKHKPYLNPSTNQDIHGYTRIIWPWIKNLVPQKSPKYMLCGCSFPLSYYGIWPSVWPGSCVAQMATSPLLGVTKPSRTPMSWYACDAAGQCWDVVEAAY